MEERTHRISRRSFLGGAAALGIVSVATPQLAMAKSSAEVQAEADAVRDKLVNLQADLEEATDKYYSAVDAHDKAKKAVDAAQDKIDEAQARISELQGKLGTRARSMYRNGGSASFLDLLLGATSFEEFATNWDILSTMNEEDAALVSETKDLKAEVEKQKTELSKQEKIAAEKQQEAADIKQAAESKAAEAEATVAALDKEAKKLLEEEQAAAARKRAEEAAKNNSNSNSNSGGGNSGGGNSGGNSNSGKHDSGGNSGGGNSGGYPAAASYAASRKGCPYVWGAEGPNAFDCSGLTKWAYAQCGVYLPHQSESQYACARSVRSVSAARTGDVLWRYGHVGIAACSGGTTYWHAPTFGASVRNTDPLSWSGFTASLRY